MSIRPAGHHVLIEVAPVDDKSKGGIIMATQNELSKEHAGRDVGVIKEFGPLAYKGLPGFPKEYITGPAEWGVQVGDRVEFTRYDGKQPRSAEQNPEYKNLRIIQDTNILMVLDAEAK